MLGPSRLHVDLNPQFIAYSSVLIFVDITSWQSAKPKLAHRLTKLTVERNV
jgi:hypothetical protein